ncbi:hypothetical protein [Flavobacterium quisquiliarum]|uniref:Uncharacterized protein n=1 Tax=Flavobacterium quisquiliarum TaxID=1834436 RepID=A0ABV8WD45_9FLAO|nr:hypothetical protein [Flavobacterium quisquiliarum]MBW1658323.1 hypothetical protein [Flavobacterium quisquiliarum]NWL02148.1 hypothetical protein [Flavobacterium collinsii]
MINNYIFNEYEKRFEPKETTCAYCEESQIKNMKDTHFVALYVTDDRTNLIVYRSVKYSTLLIGIPRCASCREIHDKSVVKSRLITWMIVPVLMGLLFYYISVLGVFLFIAGFFAIVTGGFYGSHKLTQFFVAKENIYNLQDGTDNDRVIQNLILDGWSLNQPSA